MYGVRIEVIEHLALAESVTFRNSGYEKTKKSCNKNQNKSASTTTSNNLVAVVRFRLRWNVIDPPKYLFHFRVLK